MRFIIGGEGALDYLDRMTYHGAIGLFYRDTLGGIIAYIIFGIVAILAVIGLFAVLKVLFTGFGSGSRKKRKEDPHDKWLRTGKT